MNRIMAPFAAPQKCRVFREKSLRVEGPCPFGAAMDSSALEDAGSTATTGAWPSPTITAPACQGSDKGDDGPSRGP
jgi:hypothetical protein